MSEQEIGCCGAYCGTCQAFLQQTCKGCKIGYNTGDRDITKAKCQIKVCCVSLGHQTCADCNEASVCSIVNNFYQKNGYKYRKYQEATEFIKAYGYAKFLGIAARWKNAYGKY